MCIYQAATRAICRSRLREQENITLPPKCCQHLTRPRVYPSTIPPHIGAEANTRFSVRAPPLTLLCLLPITGPILPQTGNAALRRFLVHAGRTYLKRVRSPRFFFYCLAPGNATHRHFASYKAEIAPGSPPLHVWKTMNWRYVMNRPTATHRFERGIINSALAKYVTACSTKEVPQ